MTVRRLLVFAFRVFCQSQIQKLIVLSIEVYFKLRDCVESFDTMPSPILEEYWTSNRVV